MSRIGKLPVPIPEKVKVRVQDRKVVVEGPKGKLELDLPRRTAVKVEDGKVLVSRDGDDAQAKAMHGLCRALVNNMVQGVSQGFVKKLEIQGVGFRAALAGRKITMSLGYSHPCEYDVPEGVTVKVENNTQITVEGADKHLVGQVAADLRAFYPPEPYKGKGVRYVGEQVRRKQGKTVQ